MRKLTFAFTTWLVLTGTAAQSNACPEPSEQGGAYAHRAYDPFLVSGKRVVGKFKWSYTSSSGNGKIKLNIFSSALLPTDGNPLTKDGPRCVLHTIWFPGATTVDIIFRPEVAPGGTITYLNATNPGFNPFPPLAGLLQGNVMFGQCCEDPTWPGVALTKTAGNPDEGILVNPPPGPTLNCKLLF